MKAVILALAALVTTSVFAKNLETELAPAEGQAIVLKFRTVKTQSSMCFMENTEIKITAPHTEFLAEERTDGRIELEARYLGGMCMAALGPHRGSLALDRGDSLPKLPDGRYDVVINGEDQGTLRIKGTAISFDSAQ